MHPNPAFRDNAPDLHRALIDDVGFGMVFLSTPDGPRVAHSALVSGEDDTVQFHLARSNALTPHLAGGQALIVVNGPDAYISARWYADANQVPTWNYVSVELEGTIRVLDDNELRDQLDRLSQHHEAKIADGLPWTMDKVSERHLEGMMRAIVGFEMQITTRRETVKLSQNKATEERGRLVEGLEQAGSSEIANLMRRVRA